MSVKSRDFKTDFNSSLASGIMLKLGGDRYFTSTDLQDRSGVDLFVTTPVGFYGVDVKTYSKTFRDKTGSPCLILEYVSNLENNRLVDKTKTTDYLCFAFQEQGRFILTPYLPLRSIHTAGSTLPCVLLCLSTVIYIITSKII